MRWFLSLLLLVACTTVVAQRSATPKQVLIDFRQDKTTSPPKISPATQKFVLSKVFRRYLTDEHKCNANFAGNAGDDYLKAARNAGQIVPAIIDSVTGSFTVSGQAQTLYVISVSECNAS